MASRPHPDEAVHWSNLEERGVYWGIRLLLIVYRTLGAWAFTLMIYPTVAWYWLTKPTARRSSRDYLNRLTQYDPAVNLRGTPRNTFKHLVTFSRAVLDKLAAWTGQIRYTDVVIHNPTDVDAFDSANTGVVILGSHLGNLELCRALSHQKRLRRVNVLVHTQHARAFNRALEHYAPPGEMDVIQVTQLDAGTAMMLAQRVEDGEMVVIAADRTSVKHQERSIIVPFLGAPAPFPQGPFVLASLLGCPVYTLFCIKKKRQYHLYLERFSERLEMPRKQRHTALQSHVSRYARTLERYCREAPLQWFNFYDFWALPAPAEDTPSPAGASRSNASDSE